MILLNYQNNYIERTGRSDYQNIKIFCGIVYYFQDSNKIIFQIYIQQNF